MSDFSDEEFHNISKANHEKMSQKMEKVSLKIEHIHFVRSR